jgi:hypothetical protein
MGTNDSSLFVRADASPERVAAAVEASYVARGARVIGRRHRARLDRETEPPERATLGVAVGPVVDGALGWARATVEAGLLTDVRRLARPRVAAFDVALAAQRPLVEALSPPPAAAPS